MESNFARETLTPEQISAYLSAARMDPQDIALLEKYVFWSKENPGGLKHTSLYRLRAICKAVNADHDIWEESDQFHFLADPAYEDDCLLALLYLFANSPKAEVLKSGGIPLENVCEIYKIAKRAAEQGKNPKSYDWLLRPGFSAKDISLLGTIAEKYPACAIETVVEYADLEEFKEAGFGESEEQEDSIVQSVLAAYNSVSKSYAGFLWETIFTPRTCRTPGFCVGFFEAIDRGMPHIFTQNLAFPELAVEMFEWAKCGYTDAALVLCDLQKNSAPKEFELFDPVPILAAYRRFRNRADKAKLPTPAGLYQYHNIQLIDELSAAYCKHLLKPTDLLSYRTLEEVEKLLNQAANGKPGRLDAKQLGQIWDYQYKRFCFSYADCDFSGWDARQQRTLKAIVERAVVLQNYPLTDSTPEIKVKTQSICSYSVPPRLDPELEAELSLAPEDFCGKAVLISVMHKQSHDPVPEITIYC